MVRVEENCADSPGYHLVVGDKIPTWKSATTMLAAKDRLLFDLRQGMVSSPARPSSGVVATLWRIMQTKRQAQQRFFSPMAEDGVL
ncbi:MAG: hypothetical protein HQL64_01725 [Magnetococcales bacterium]|nr:hypothetical protein [Magnetococcales bacterium]